MFTLLGAGQTTDVAVGADLGVSAGLIPVEPNAPPSPAMTSTATLLSGIRIRSARTSFLASYKPQFFYQYPNVADINRPLILHRLDGSFSTNLSPRSSLSWSASGAIGELNYANLLSSFEGGTSAVASGVVPIVVVTTNGTFQYQTAPRNGISVSGTGSYRTSLESDPQQVSAIPTSHNWGISVTDTYTLTPRDNVGASVGVTYVYRPPDTGAATSFPNSLNGTMTANWQRTLNQRSTLSVRVGGAVSKSEVTGDVTGFPTAVVSHAFQARSLGSLWVNSLAAGFQGTLDPLLATFRPNAVFSWGLTGRHTDAWSSSAGLNLSVPLAKPLVPTQYETYGLLNLSLNYQTPTGFVFRGGVASSIRAAHPADLQALTPSFDATAFLGLRYTIGTGTAAGGWL